jgi:hypothetical protein
VVESKSHHYQYSTPNLDKAKSPEVDEEEQAEEEEKKD